MLKTHKLMVVSALVVFLYGSITWGIFPFDRTMSWEGHLFGAISGILVAYNYRKEGPQMIEYQWPEEEIDLEHLDDDLIIYSNSEALSPEQTGRDSESTDTKPSLDPFNVVYHYKPTNEPTNEAKES